MIVNRPLLVKSVAFITCFISYIHVLFGEWAVRNESQTYSSLNLCVKKGYLHVIKWLILSGCFPEVSKFIVCMYRITDLKVFLGGYNIWKWKPQVEIEISIIFCLIFYAKYIITNCMRWL
jgi:hypothetical protein